MFSVSPGSLSLYGNCGVLVFPGSVPEHRRDFAQSCLPKALGVTKAKICPGRSLRIAVIFKKHKLWSFPAQGLLDREEEGASLLSKGLSLLTELALGSEYLTLHLGTQVFPHLPTAEPNQRTHREHGSVHKPGILSSLCMEPQHGPQQRMACC